MTMCFLLRFLHFIPKKYVYDNNIILNDASCVCICVCVCRYADKSHVAAVKQLAVRQQMLQSKKH